MNGKNESRLITDSFPIKAQHSGVIPKTIMTKFLYYQFLSILKDTLGINFLLFPLKLFSS